MTYGVNTTGFTRKTFDNIYNDIANRLIAKFGPIDKDPDSVIDEFLIAVGIEISNIWETVENIYNVRNPVNSSGINLDNNTSLIGMTRLPAVPSGLYAIMYGTNGTVIATGKQIKRESPETIFALETAMTISVNNIADCIIEITAIVNNFNYYVQIGTVTYTFNSGSSATNNSIIAGLESLIEASGLFAVVNLGDGKFSITSNDGKSGYAYSLSSNLSFDTVGTPGYFLSIENGPISGPINTVNVINTPVTNWDSVNNLVDAFPGRLQETDTELMLRREAGFNIAGAASLSAILTRLPQLVPEITEVHGYHNNEMVTTNGIPPKSVEIVCVGGSDADIANALWILVAGGIKTYGNTTESITDSEGFEQVIKFSRPQNFWIYLQITITLDSEEIFPYDGTSQIKENAAEYGNTIVSGKDIILQRFFRYVYNVPGVENITITASKVSVGSPASTYTSDNIVMLPTQKGIFDVSRIEVIVS